MKTILGVFLLLFFSVEAQTQTILNADGSVAQTAEESAAILKRAEQRRLDDLASRMPGANSTLAQPDINRETRAATGCEEAQTSLGKLYICSQTLGGTNGGSPVYILNGAEFDGRVRKRRDGTYELVPTEQTNTQSLRHSYSGPPIPAEFSCGSQNTNEFQCLVCSCFFEGRGEIFPEQVRISRTKHSRVLNPRFPNSICENVHYRNPTTNVAAYSWVRDAEDNKIFKNAQGTLMRPINVTLGEGSSDLDEPQKNAFRSCTRSAAESLHVKDEYFASYYWTKSVEGSRGWMKTCDQRTSHIEDNIIRGYTDANGNEILFAHNFRKICGETGEAGLLNYAPRRSLKPQLRPAGASGVLE